MLTLTMVLYTFITCFLMSSNSARILAVFPSAYKSHFYYNDAIMKSLHAVNHHVTYITPFTSDSNFENYTIVNPKSHPIVYTDKSIEERASRSIYEILTSYVMNDLSHCEDIMNVKEIQVALQSKEKLYDIMFVDMLCFVPIAEKLNIPVISTVGTHTLKIFDSYIGMPNNPATVPFEMTNMPLKMTFIHRLQNTCYHLICNYVEYIIGRHKLNQFYQRHFPNYVHDRKKISIMFYNNHHTYLSRPCPPGAVDIAGIHIKTAKHLPKNLQFFIDGAKHGVVLFTFGSLVKGSSIPDNLKTAFVDAFARIPQHVIWKFEDPIKNLSKNVLLSKWLPQRDILEHEKVIAFISHCGQAGVYEAIHTGTPIVAIPYSFDQHSNAAILQDLGVSVTLDVHTTTSEKVNEALNEVINNISYKKAMLDLSRRFRDRPMSPEESVVYWTEYVLRNDGARNLRTVGADMPWYQYLLLDVIGFIIVVAIITLGITFYVFKKLCRLAKNSFQLNAISRNLSGTNIKSKFEYEDKLKRF